MYLLLQGVLIGCLCPARIGFVAMTGPAALFGRVCTFGTKQPGVLCVVASFRQKSRE